VSFYGALESFGDATALIENGHTLTYRELQQACDAFARQITPQRALILIAAKNDMATVTAYLSALQNGHVAMMIGDDMPDTLLAPILQSYTPNYLYRDGTLETLHVTPLNLHEKLALLIPTSGTTGSEKMIRLSYRNLEANTASILGYLHLTCNDTAITTLPLYYSFGLSILNTHLGVGGRVVLTSEGLLSRSFWEQCDAHAVTSFSGVPYHYDMLRRLGFEKLPQSVRMLTQAGGKMHEKAVAALGAWCQTQGKALYVMYGQSEATARISYLDPEKVLQKPASIGRAIPGGHLEIVNDELIYRGDNVMLGYAVNAADLARGDDCGGVLATGDLGYQDDEGDFYVTGRIKRFIKLHGLRISLDAVEQFLKARGIEAMCGGDDTALVIGTRDAEGIRKLICDTFALHHSVVKVRTLEQLFVKPSGKYDYAALMEQRRDA